MKLYRFSSLKYTKVLDGKGAALHGGRWNSMGRPMIYASSSASLAYIELLRRFLPRQVPLDYCLIEYEVPDDVGIREIPVSVLSEEWNSALHGMETQKLGDAFLDDEKELILKVPSVLLPSSYHYNINPLHRDMTKLQISKIDERPMNLALFA